MQFATTWKDLLGIMLSEVGQTEKEKFKKKKESDYNAGDLGFNPWVRKIPWKKELQLTPVFLPGKFHGQRSLAGYSPWSCKE